MSFYYLQTVNKKRQLWRFLFTRRQLTIKQIQNTRLVNNVIISQEP